MPSFTLTVIGTDFVSDSKIVFNGVEKETTYISSTELTCEINPEDIAVVPITVPVQVSSPSPGGGDSNTIEFSVPQNHTFDDPKNISNTSGECWEPDLEIDNNGIINIVWDDDTVGNYEILFSQSSDDGLSWSQFINVSSNSYSSYSPKIAADSSGNLNIVWHDNTSPNWDIHFSRSTDIGASWSSEQDITGTVGQSRNSGVALNSSGDIFVVWDESTSVKDEIYFRYSTDNGASWSPIVNLSNNSGESSYPAIAVDGAGNINVAWHDDTSGTNKIHYSRSTDNGTSWSLPKILPSNSQSSMFPAIAVDDSGNICAVWRDIFSSNTEIFFCHSGDSGANWSGAKNLSSSSGYSEYPKLVMDNAGNTNVVWSDDSGTGPYQILFSRSTDFGTSWSPPIKISATLGDSFSPAIGVDEYGNISIVWTGITSSSFNWEIFYTGSTR